jgi:small conductance mechanosensitive channel
MQVSEAFNLQRVLGGLIVVGVEAALVVGLCATFYLITRTLLRIVAARNGSLRAWSGAARLRTRNLVLAAGCLLLAMVLAWNAWLVARGTEVWGHTIALARGIGLEVQAAAAVALGKLALAAIVLLLGTRLVRQLLRLLERSLNRWDMLERNNQSLSALFAGVYRAIVTSSWLLLAVFAAGLVGAPQAVAEALLLIVRVYLVIALGLLIIRCTSVIVDTFDGLSERSARRRGWLPYYDRLRPLLPTFRACLEYALWIGLGSAVMYQLTPLSGLAVWGPRLIQAIAIFFAGRVVIELGSLEIQHRMLPAEGLEETQRRRRITMVPLVRTAFIYGTYFGTAVLMLGAMGFNPMPFLAGAGILGLVIGFGAQSLINDVVSGFFILLENIYLVGDTVEVAPAKGVVEAIEFRTTKIRDADGRVHIIRNGDMKPVINYSKGYTMAVVAVDVAYDADLRSVFGLLRQAAGRLRAENPDVLDETRIDGITAFGGSSMTVRTTTRVKPGRQEEVAASLRLAIKETVDRLAPGVPRKTLIPHAVETPVR